MTFTEYLTQLIEARKLSKNKLIRETGIDRSSFFKFLKGSSEIPAEAAVIPLLNHGSRFYIIKKTGNCSLSLFLPWRFQNVPSHIQTYYLLKYR